MTFQGNITLHLPGERYTAIGVEVGNQVTFPWGGGEATATITKVGRKRNFMRPVTLKIVTRGKRDRRGRGKARGVEIFPRMGAVLRTPLRK